MNGKPILSLDFDGVCHSYTSGWQGVGVIPDPPVKGLFEFLQDAQHHFIINIFSSRSHQSGGIDAMKAWFNRYYYPWAITTKYSATNIVEELRFPEVKPPALVALDDRAILFTGEWPSPKELRKFKPWNKE